MNELSDERMQRITDLLFEVGILRHTPRSGYQFLGTGAENVAEHSFRTAVIAYVLAKLAKADCGKAVLIALFHDLGEARTGDLNLVNRQYGSLDERKAVATALEGTGFEEELLPLVDEHAKAKAGTATQEGFLAADADQLDLLLNLKRELDLGNRYAAEWIQSIMLRLQTTQAKELAQYIIHTDHAHWWMSRMP